jgi:uncharacterized protein (DUF488 family)
MSSSSDSGLGTGHEAHVVFTIGHSTHDLEEFLDLLRLHDISAVADVRSSPYSRMNPQFNREDLKKDLKAVGIAYVFLGEELGARSDDPGCYENDKVQYDRLAKTALFRRGLERVCKGVASHRLALMCAEKEPLDCHRTILVARHLAELELKVQHILADGSLEPHGHAIERLKKQLKLAEDMFKPTAAVTDEAYQIQGVRIAYELPKQTSAPVVDSEASR